MSSTIGRRLRQLRERKGHTQESLAAASGVCLSVIRKIENGGTARLQTYEKLAEALEVEVMWFADPEAADTAESNYEVVGRSLAAVIENGEPGRENIIATTREVVNAVISMPEIRVLFTEERCPLDGEGVRGLAQVVGTGLERQYSSKGGAPLYNTAIALHDRVLVWLAANYKKTTTDALEIFSSELCVWIGWLTIDAGRDDLAHVYLSKAVLHARMADCSLQEICAMNNLAILHVRTGKAHRAARVVDVALNVDSSIPPRLRALLHLRGAVGCGYLGDAPGFEEHADSARRAFALGPQPDEPTWFKSFSELEMTGLLGWGELELGRPVEASDSFQATMSQLDPASIRARAHYNIQLGRALALQGAHREAAECGLAALSEVKTLKSRPILDDFRSLYLRLSSQRDARARSFTDACRETVLLSHLELGGAR